MDIPTEVVKVANGSLVRVDIDGKGTLIKMTREEAEKTLSMNPNSSLYVKKAAPAVQPSDDLAAANAEIERLRAQLQQQAGDEGKDEGKAANKGAKA